MMNLNKNGLRGLCLAAFLTMINSSAVMAGGLPEVTGHRGGASIAPENTVMALETSIKQGIQYAEVDASQTSDGVLILLHDNNLKRVTGFDANVRDVAWGDIISLNKDHKYGPSYSRYQIPQLSTAMDSVGGKLKLNIELKHTGRETPDYVDRVLGLINARGMQDQCVITSFYYPYLERVKRLTPNIKTGYITCDAAADFNAYPAADCFSLNQEILTKDIVNAIHASGRQVYAWTVNDRAAILRCVELGADNIIGDDPVYIKRVIGAS